MKRACMTASVGNIPCATSSLAAFTVGPLCPQDPAIFHNEFLHNVPLAHIDSHPTGIVKEQLVEFHTLDLVSVGIFNERLRYDVAKVDVYYVPSRAPTPHAPEFRCETRLARSSPTPRILQIPSV